MMICWVEIVDISFILKTEIQYIRAFFDHFQVYTGQIPIFSKFPVQSSTDYPSIFKYFPV